MILGPEIIIECPHCKALAKVFTLESGNMSHVQRRTDGKIIAPMLPRPPVITKCNGCGYYYWVSDAPQVGEMPFTVELKLVVPLEKPDQNGNAHAPESSLRESKSDSIPSSWKTAERVRELSELEHLEAIQRGVADNRDQELQLRIGAWWAGNDSSRFTNSTVTEENRPPLARIPKATESLERLSEMLNVSDSLERLLKAEALRELGRFDQSLEVLSGDFPKEHQFMAGQIGELALRRDPQVRLIVGYEC